MKSLISFTPRFKSYPFFVLLGLIVLFQSNKAFSQDKGTCTAPYATLTVYTSFSAADAAFQNQKQTWSPDATGTINTYARINSGPDGKVGFDLSHNVGAGASDQGCVGNAQREIRLFPESLGACNWATGITYSVADGGNGATWSNPEFYGLTANTDYIVQVKTIIPNTGGCAIQEQYLTYYQITNPVAPCGTVGFDWRAGQSPAPSSPFSCSDNTDYSLKADATGTTAGDEGSYIAPGFTIYNDAGVTLSDIQVKEGAASYVSVYPNKIVTYCVPTYVYLVRISGAGSGNIIIKDNATANVLNTTAFSNNMVITLNAGTIQGTSTYSGTGVSNYKKGQSTSYVGSGYGVFNPSLAGPGNHTITYSWDNGAGCSGTSTLQVVVNGATTPNAMADFQECANTPLSLTSTGSNLIWYSNPGLTTQIGTGSPCTPAPSTGGTVGTITTYYVTSTVGGCESQADSVKVTVKTCCTPPTIDSQPSGSTVCTGANASMTIAATGTGTLTYQWQKNGVNYGSTTNTLNLTPAVAGTYTCIVTDGACNTTSNSAIIVVSSPTTPNFLPITPICKGDVAPTFILTSPNGITGTWSPSTINNQTTATYTFTPTAGQCATTQVLNSTINIPPAPLYSKASIDATCQGSNNGSITITSTDTDLTYNWVSGPLTSPIPSGNMPNGATDERALTNLAPGTYCVDITKPAGTSTITLLTEDFESGASNWAIDNSTGPNIFIINNSYTGGQCVSGAGTFTVNAVPNQPNTATGFPQSQYLHIMATTTTGAVCGAGSSNPFPPLNANFDGVSSDQKVTLTSPISTLGYSNIKFNFLWLAQGDASGNDYGSIEYSTNGGSNWTAIGAKLYSENTWQVGTRTDPSWNNISDLRFRIRWNNNTSSSIDPPLAIDQITVTAEVSSTCDSTVQECFTIGAGSALTTPTFSAVGPLCQGTTASALPTSSTNSLAITGTWAPAITTASAGTTTYTFTPTAGQCANTQTMDITVNAPTTPDFASIPNYCVGSAVPTFSNQSPNGINGTWSPSSINNQLVGANQYIFTPTVGQCANNYTATVTGIAKINPTFSAIPDPCVGDVVTLPTSSTNTPAISGAWSAVNTSTATTVSPLFTPNSNECANTYTMNITVREYPVIDLGTDLCVETGSAILNLSGNTAYNYVWNTTETTTSIVATETGTYSVVASNHNCTSTDEIYVKIYPSSPTIVFDLDSSTFCSHKTITISEISGNPSDYTYSWSPMSSSSNSAVFSPNGPGVYTIILAKTACPGNPVIDSLTVTAIECTVTVPNVFTPNSDGYNDKFHIKGLEDYANTKVSIFNRWGKPVFVSSNYQNNWDGDNLSDGTYYYIIEFPVKTMENMTGTLNIVRDGK